MLKNFRKLFVPVMIALFATLAITSGAFAEGPWSEFTLKLGPQTTLTERTIKLLSGEGIKFGTISGLSGAQNINVTVTSSKGLTFNVQKPGDTVTTGCVTSDAEICAVNFAVDATAKEKSLIVYGAKNQVMYVTFKVTPTSGNVTISGKQYVGPKLPAVVDLTVDLSGETLALDVFPVSGETLFDGDKIVIRAAASSVFAADNLFAVGDEFAHYNGAMKMYLLKVEWTSASTPLGVSSSGRVAAVHFADSAIKAEYAIVRAAPAK